jgi:hypothetical protein
MTQYHAVLLDETGCEFGADCQADSHDQAYEYFKEQYPESSVVQLEDPDDTARREKALYDHAWRMAFDDDYAYMNDDY